MRTATQTRRLDPTAAMHLYAAHEQQILATRQRLLQRIESSAPRFRDTIAEALERRARNSSSPLLGELMPWMLADLGGVEEQMATDVAAGWLALYVYAAILDDQIDAAPGKVTAQITLAGPLLFQIGLSQLKRFTSGTAFDLEIDNALYVALEGQLLDAERHGSLHNLALKEWYSASKNTGLIACAAAFAGASDGRLAFLREFVEPLLLGFQYLDDIADRHDDLRQGNYTVLLSHALRSDGEVRQLNRPNRLTAALLRSGALVEVLNKVSEALRAALTVAEENPHVRRATPTCRFFEALRADVVNLQAEVSHASALWSELAPRERQSLVSRIERRLAVVAQSS